MSASTNLLKPVLFIHEANRVECSVGLKLHAESSNPKTEGEPFNNDLHSPTSSQMRFEADLANKIYHLQNVGELKTPYGPCPGKCKKGFTMQRQIGDGEYDWDFCPICNGHEYVDQITGKGVPGPEKKN